MSDTQFITLFAVMVTGIGIIFGLQLDHLLVRVGFFGGVVLTGMNWEGGATEPIYVLFTLGMVLLLVWLTGKTLDETRLLRAQRKAGSSIEDLFDFEEETQ